MPISGKFLGETKGNRTNPINVSESALGSVWDNSEDDVYAELLEK